MVNPWYCAHVISVSGAAGGVVNALLTDNGFILPTRVKQIWCPGFISNVLIGTFSAFCIPVLLWFRGWIRCLWSGVKELR